MNKRARRVPYMQKNEWMGNSLTGNGGGESAELGAWTHRYWGKRPSGGRPKGNARRASTRTIRHGTMVPAGPGVAGAAVSTTMRPRTRTMSGVLSLDGNVSGTSKS